MDDHLRPHLSYKTTQQLTDVPLETSAPHGRLTLSLVKANQIVPHTTLYAFRGLVLDIRYVGERNIVHHLLLVAPQSHSNCLPAHLDRLRDLMSLSFGFASWNGRLLVVHLEQLVVG